MEPRLPIILESLHPNSTLVKVEMSCNGCRILRKGCSDTCILRPSLELIESAEAQAHATVFVAKFFGRAGLMSFISAVPENQRPALFQSLLFEAAGRTVNPVSGALGLLWTGNWHVCQAAVATVLRGAALHPIPGDFDCTDIFKLDAPRKRRRSPDAAADLDLSLTAGFPAEKQRLGSSSINSEESVITSCPGQGIQILKLFN